MSLFSNDLAKYQSETSGRQEATSIGQIKEPTSSFEIPTFQSDLLAFQQEKSPVDIGEAETAALKANKARMELEDIREKATPVSVSEESGQMSQELPKQSQGNIIPSGARVTQKFGQASQYDVFSGGINYGTDFATPVGTNVAVPEGEWEVVDAYGGSTRKGFIGNNDNSGYGNSVLVKNTKTGEQMRFSHLSQVGVKRGQILRAGQVFAKTGATGNVTGPHLDLEYRDSSGKLSNVEYSPYRKALFGK